MKDKFVEFTGGFINGLTESSVGSLIVAILTVLAIFFLITPNVVRLLPPEYLMLNPRDESIIVTNKALNLRFEPSPSLSVTLIGASTLREALTEEQDISRRLSNKLNTEIVVNKITAPGMRPWDVASLIDCIPSNYKGIVVICIGLGYDPKELKNKKGLQTRFAIPSPSFDAEIKRVGCHPPFRTGIYFFDYFGYLSAHSADFVKSLVFGPVSSQIYRHDGKVLAKDGVKKYRKRARRKIKKYLKYAGHNYASLSRNFERLKRDGLYAVYLQPTRNMDFIEPIYKSIYSGDLIKKIKQDSERFSIKMGIEYWNFNIKEKFGYEDFSDSCHLSNHTARDRYTDLLVERLAYLIHSRFGNIL